MQFLDKKFSSWMECYKSLQISLLLFMIRNLRKQITHSFHTIMYFMLLWYSSYLQWHSLQLALTGPTWTLRLLVGLRGRIVAGERPCWSCSPWEHLPLSVSLSHCQIPAHGRSNSFPPDHSCHLHLDVGHILFEKKLKTCYYFNSEEYSEN